MHDIFISYSRKDRATAQRLAELLGQQGWSVWWDRIIPIGKSFDGVIEEALESAKCVLVLWSKSSASSDWVKAEAGEGLSRGVLIPVLIEETRIPLGFRQLQTANLLDWQTGQEHPEIQLMLEAIAQKAGAPSKVLIPKERKRKRTTKASKASRATKAQAFQAETVLQKDVLQLIEYAKNHFQGIIGEQESMEHPATDDTPFKSTFNISGTSNSTVWRRSDGTHFFDGTFVQNVDEQKAIDIFKKRVSELKPVFGKGWTVEVKEDKTDDTIIKNMDAVTIKGELIFSINLYRFGDNDYWVMLLLSEL